MANQNRNSAKPNNGLLWLVLLLAALLPHLHGCGEATRQRIIKVLFTGVPEQGRAVAPSTQEPLAGAVKKDATATKSQQSVSVHPLYSARKCDACHQSSSIIGLGAKGDKGSRALPSGPVGALLMPKEVLCGWCHVCESSGRTLTERIWVHPPVVKGECLFCHDVHGGATQNYLLKEPLGSLCVRCHPKCNNIYDEARRPSEEAFRESSDCAYCHNPHLGKDIYRLRVHYDELLPRGAVENLWSGAGGWGGLICP